MGTEGIANILSLDAEKVGASLKNLAGKTNPLVNSAQVWFRRKKDIKSF